MASPNASLALRLQQSPTYTALGATYRQAWLEHCLKLGEDRVSKPRDGEVYETLPDKQMSKLVLQRLNDYGIAAGCAFAICRSDFKHPHPNVTFTCVFFGSKTANKHKIPEERVTRDGEGRVITQRSRNTNHSRLGCRVKYRIAFKGDGSGGRQWIGNWVFDTHEYHPFPLSPMEFKVHKKQIQDYQILETVGLKYRSARVPYSEARRLFLEEGTGMLMTQKEYYNLAARKWTDISIDDTPGALCATLNRDGWRYCLRTEEVDDGLRIVQVFFWYHPLVDFIRRFTSNSLLIVDATFRTNHRGLPLLIATGKSNTESTFPIAFSWVPEEDTKSYTFFYECLRKEIYQGIPEPAVVLVDISAGMTSAYDKCGCLPDSELQYCNWHAVEAMLTWFRDAGYTSDEVKLLKALCWVYVQSNTFIELEFNRQAILEILQEQHHHYILETCRKREERVIQCYTKNYSNLGAYSTQRAEGFNRKIHTWTNHQMTLQQAAIAITSAVEDIYRDFQHDIMQSQIKIQPGMNRQAFSLLVGSISLFAINLIHEQWKILLTNTQKECTGSFRKQYLLPCSHDLQRAYNTGLPIPKSLVHPRWWVEGHTPTTAAWEPSYQAIEPVIATSSEKTMDQELDNLMQTRQLLQGEYQRDFDTVLADVFEQATELGRQRQQQASLPLTLPVVRAHRIKPIPTRGEAQILELRRKQRQEAQIAKDAHLLYQRQQAEQAQQAMATLPEGDTITVKLPLPPPPSPSPTPPELPQVMEESGQAGLNLEEDQQLDCEPPASTAPPRLEDSGIRRGKRVRSNTTKYLDMIEHRRQRGRQQ
jgi:hypothetical protein